MKIVVVGSGISGMSAAIQAAELGAQVELLSPYISERSQSVMAAGGINAALDTLGEGDSTKCHAQDTLKGGCFLENERLIQSFCDKAPDNLHWIESMGLVLNRDKNRAISLRAFGGQTHKRTAYAGASTGKQIVSALVQKCREFEVKGKISRRTNLNFHSALIKDGTCYGVVVTDSITGKVFPFYADVTIMAAGGQNKLFGKTTGTEICDGYAAGRLFSQGVELRNLEFIQYHPTTIETPHKRMLISEAARGEGGRLYYEKGDKRCYFMEEKYGKNGNLMPRDIVSQCIYNCPSQVYLDITFLGEKLIHERLGEIYELCMDYISLDVTKESIPVCPAVHFFMGGIAVDSYHETNIHNLYAVGECASKYHGANRLGGNSLMAAVHSGRTAAHRAMQKNAAGPTQSAPRVTNRQNVQNLFANYIQKIEAEIANLQKSESLYPSARVLDDIAKVMNKNLGITRCEEDLQAGIHAINSYLAKLPQLKFDSCVDVYENYKPYYMALLAKAILLSASARKESRGAHMRTDYPESLEAFKKCSYAKLINEEITISFREEAY